MQYHMYDDPCGIALRDARIDEALADSLMAMYASVPPGGTGRLAFNLAILPQQWYTIVQNKFGSTTRGRKQSYATTRAARITFARRAADIAIGYMKDTGKPGQHGHSYQPR